MQKDWASFSPHIYCKNNMKIKALHLVQGPVWMPGKYFFLSHPQPKLLLFVLLMALGKLSPAAASEKDFDVPHGRCCALLVIFLLYTTCHCFFPKNKIPMPHGSWAGPRYYFLECRCAHFQVKSFQLLAWWCQQQIETSDRGDNGSFQIQPG